MSIGEARGTLPATSDFTKALTGSWLIAVVLYVVVSVGSCAIIGLSVAGILEQRSALAQTSDLMNQLQGRKARIPTSSAPAGSGAPLLEGPTVTVAGAALLQRVAAAVGQAGGTIQSSLVDVLGAQAKEGFIGIVISCEMDQSALQGLLYDLEAGTPFLFIDQLDVQAPQTAVSTDSEAIRVRVLLGVSGLWQGNR